MGWRHAGHIEAGIQAVYIVQTIHRRHIEATIRRALYGLLTFTPHAPLPGILGQEDAKDRYCCRQSWWCDSVLSILLRLFPGAVVCAWEQPATQHPKTLPPDPQSDPRCPMQNLIQNMMQHLMLNLSNCAQFAANLCAQLLAKQPVCGKNNRSKYSRQKTV